MNKHRNAQYVNYVKGIEKLNDEMDTRIMQLSAGDQRAANRLTQLEGANEDLSRCLEILLERYSSDDMIKKTIMSTLQSVAKKLAGEKY